MAAVLLVEHESIVAVALEAAVLRSGHEVFGSVPSVARAVGLLAKGRCPAAALLSISLIDGEAVYPVADALVARGVPFALMTGASQAIPPRFAGRLVLFKPFAENTVIATIKRLLNAA
jgi:hypothetical protein